MYQPQHSVEIVRGPLLVGMCANDGKIGSVGTNNVGKGTHTIIRRRMYGYGWYRPRGVCISFQSSGMGLLMLSSGEIPRLSG